MSRADKVLRRKHRKENKSGTRQREILRRDLRTGAVEDASSAEFQLSSYSISFDAMNGGQGDAFIDEVSSDDRHSLYIQCQDHPKIGIPKLEALHVRFPESPTVLNWLTVAHESVGNVKEVNRLVRLNWELHPDYLFARTSHAQLLLRDGKLDEAAEVMGNKWDLKLMYPDRDVFHITEFTAFASVAIEYLFRTKQVKPAEQIFKILKQLAPDHPATARLEMVISGSALLMLSQLVKSGIRGGRSRF